MIRIIKIALLIIIYFSLFISGQGISQVAVVTIPDTTGVQDSIIYIPIKVDLKNQGITCYEFELTFNPNILTPFGDGVSKIGTMTESWSGPFVNTKYSGRIIAGGFYNPTDTLIGTGNLLKLIFIIKGSIGDTTHLKFSYFTFNNGYPYAYKKNGLFKVIEHIPSSVANHDINHSNNIRLYPNYPDPFMNSTTVPFSLKNRHHVTIKIFNVLGQEVTTLIDNETMPDAYLLPWDGKDKFGNIVPTGIYYCVMRTEGFVAVERMTFIK